MLKSKKKIKKSRKIFVIKRQTILQRITRLNNNFLARKKEMKNIQKYMKKFAKNPQKNRKSKMKEKPKNLFKKGQ